MQRVRACCCLERFAFECVRRLVVGLTLWLWVSALASIWLWLLPWLWVRVCGVCPSLCGKLVEVENCVCALAPELTV